jgi:outer membrane protein assembly factor BamB
MLSQFSTPTYADLIRSPVSHFSWKIIKSFDITPPPEEQSPSIEMPGFWVNPDGDTLCIFQNRQIQWQAPNRNKTDIYAVNLRTLETAWKVEDLQKCNCTSNVAPPLVWQDKVYILGFLSAYCLDAATGALIWEKKIGDPVLDQLFSTNPIIEDGVLVISTNSGRMHGLDPNTGAKLWSNDLDKASASNMEAHNGIAYIGGSEYLYAVDVKTGKSIARVKSKSWEAFGYVAINHDLGLVYVNDYYFTYCYKVIR